MTGPRWRPTAAPVAAVLVGVPLIAVGLLVARPDVAVLGLPLAIAAAVAFAAPRHPEHDVVAVHVEQPDGAELPYRIDVAAPKGVDAVHLRVRTFGGAMRELVIAPRPAGGVGGRMPLLHSGPQEFLRVGHRLVGPDAAQLGEVGDPVTAEGVISPAYSAIRSLPLPRRLAGLTGGHDSARPGEGGDFRDVHPFRSGDRLRRIDWKATARRGGVEGELYVRRTTATADATVVIVVDSRDDVGEQVTQWSRSSPLEKGITSLDLARECASSIAAGYLRAGDRVGFQDLASRARVVAPGGGTRHLHRVLSLIEPSRPSGPPTRRRRPPVIPPGALVYVLSTFLDDEAPRMAAMWRAGGHRVIAVDVLPAPRFEGTGAHERLAHRIVSMERDDRMRALAVQGVELLRWPDDDPANPREGRVRALARPVRGGR